MKRYCCSVYNKRNWIFFITILAFFSGCSLKKNTDHSGSVVQISTIDALMQGVYDGPITLKELAQYGDFGIGTFNALNGEMVFLDDMVYQVKADGKIYCPSSMSGTPFATVTFFNPEMRYNLNGLSFREMKMQLDSLIPSPNLFYAIKLKGTFRSVKTRSVPGQKKPYPKLVEVTANQPEFIAQEVSGIVMGFYCPPFVNGINVPGYHLHFLSDDKNFGGHLLEFEMESGLLQVDKINNFKMILPEENSFLSTDLKTDLSDDVKAVEGS